MIVGRFLIRIGNLLLAAMMCSGCSRSASEVPAPKSTIAFTDITQEAGLGNFHHENGAAGQKWMPEIMGAGAAFIDYNGDGWLDVLMAGGGTWKGPSAAALWLYHNQRDGTFSLVTREKGLNNLNTYGFGFAVADYDNDGDEDFYFTTLSENLLFRNEGGVFTEVGRTSGVAGLPVWSTSSIFFDADRDGYLDLYVGNYVAWSPDEDLFCTDKTRTKAYCTPELYEGIPGRFYHNNGDGTLTDRTEVAGFMPAPGKTLGVAELDFNHDGWPDLVVANDTERDLLYKNNGDMGQAPTFTEVGVVSGVAYDDHGRARAGMGIDAGVVDATGEETIFIGNFSNEMIGVYRHLGNGLFEDRAALSKIGHRSRRTLAFGLFLFDVELDGDLDFFVANGHIHTDVDQVPNNIVFRQPPHLFINDNAGTFRDAVPDTEGSMAQSMLGRGAAYADIDRDGDLDILVTQNGGPVRLLRNETRSLGRANDIPAFLRVSVTGTKSNRSGLGAKIEIFTSGKRQVRRVHSGSSYLSQSETVVTFGLGETNRVDSLNIYWPSGEMNHLADLAVNQTLRFVEGEGL